MEPAFFELQFFWVALFEALDVIGNPGDDNPDDIHFLTQRSDIRQHHIEGKKRGNTCIGGQRFQFIHRIHRIQVNDDGPQIQSGIIGNDILGTIRQVNPDAVAFFNTHLPQSIGHPQDLLPEVPEGYFGTVKIGCRFVGKIAGGNV